MPDENDQDKTSRRSLRPQFAAYPVTAISGLKLGAAVTTIIQSSIEYSYGVSMSEKLVAAIQEIATTVCIVGVLFAYDAIRRYFKTRSTDYFGEEGMTLIELLVVVTIIGMLAAIAVPQFASYRRGALETGARSDLRNAAVAEEAYFVENNEYATSLEALKAHGFRQSQGVTLTIEASASEFSMKAKVQGCAGELVYSQVEGRISGKACE